MYSISANIEKETVFFSGNSLKIEQQIPILYETKEVCARTGRRRFVIAGPRSKECYIQQIPRGLNEQEIAEVKQSLINKSINR